MSDSSEEHDPDILRTVIETAAERPLDDGPDIAALTEYVRTRRRRRSLLQAAGATTGVAAVLVAAVALATALPSGGPAGRGVSPDNTDALTPTSGGSHKPSSSPTTANTGTGGAATGAGTGTGTHSPQTSPTALQPDRPGVVCGQRLTAQYTAQAPGGVHLAVTAVHPKPPATAPTVDVALTADRDLTVLGSSHQLQIQVVVVHDGTVVDRIGGADWPEDFSPQPGQQYGDGLEARSWPVTAAGPHTEQIAPSHWTACPGADWSAVYADPSAYQLIALMPMPIVSDSNGPVGDRADTMLGSAFAAVNQDSISRSSAAGGPPLATNGSTRSP